MKYLFTITTPKSPNATHTRDADGVCGRFREIPDTAIIRGPGTGLLNSKDGYTPIPSAPELPVPAVVVPREIKNWQAKAVLEAAGAIAAVDAALNLLPGENGLVVRAAWVGGEPLKRGGETVAAIAAALSFTAEQVDAWFVQAAALSVP